MENMEHNNNSGEKTFTQEDVNRIVQERLAREQGKGTNDLDKREAELDKRERRLNAIDKLRENNLPDYLVDALNMETEDAFKASMDVIIKMKGETDVREPQPRVIGTISPIGNVGGNGGSSDPIRKAFGLK